MPTAMPRQLVRFAAIGVASTVAHLLLFLLFRGMMGAIAANVVALLLTSIANTAANRRLTFGVRGRDGAARHQFQGLIVFGLGLGLTTGALALLGVPGAGREPGRRAGRPRRRQRRRHRAALRPLPRLGVPPAHHHRLVGPHDPESAA